MYEWLFRVGDIFVILLVFGLITNGMLRKRIIAVGFLGALGILFTSIVVSIIDQSLLFLGVIIEYIFVFFLFLAIFGFLFRNVQKPKQGKYDYSDPNWAKKFMKDIEKGK